MSEKRCFGCMQPKQSSPICEHCGHDERRPNAPHQLPPGTVLNNQYIVGKALGQGGFGITYIGWDQFLGIPVAIKEFYPSGIVTRDTTRAASVFLTGEQVKDRFVTNRDRFVREATSLARLGRSSGAANIVTVHNLVQANATAYIIMEYVDGIDLRKCMKQQGGVLTLEETLRLLLPVMESLEKVHESHIVHRDISPDNIMVMPDGSTKLIDFGAAHEVQQDEEGNQKSTEAILKYGFAPPEQYQRKGELGPWTDVYALCATIYFCTTGKLPPNATDRVLGAEDFEWEKIPGISGSMARALQKGTAIRKNERIQSMAQLREALLKEEAENDIGVIPQVYPTGTVALEDQKTLPLRDSPEQNNPIPIHTAPVAPPEDGPTRPHRDSVQPIVQPPIYTAPVEERGNPAVERTDPLSPHTAPVMPQIDSNNREDAFRKEQAVPEQEGQTPKPQQGSRRILVYVAAIVLALVAGVLLLKTFTGPKSASTLMSDTWDEGDGTVFDSDYGRDQIASVHFLDNQRDAPSSCWDVSESGDGSVVAWVEESQHVSGCYDLYLAGKGKIYAPVNCSQLFASYRAVTAFHFNNCFDTENAENMGDMFYGCSSLSALDLSGFDTSSVTQMGYMFYGCSNLSKLDVSGFDTSNVLYMGEMFANCSSLTALDVSGFHTENVTGMGRMFLSCISLTSLDLSSFDTRNVSDMEAMFSYCVNLSDLDVSSFDTSNVTNMRFMFSQTPALTNIIMPKIQTGKLASGQADGFMDDGDTLNGKTWAEYFGHTEKKNGPSIQYFIDQVTGDESSDNEPWQDNVLMHTYDGEEREFAFNYRTELTVFRSDFHCDQILSVTFLDTLAEEPADSWDVSHDKNGSVKAWAKPNGKLYDLFIAAESGINGKIACDRMFYAFSNLNSIRFNGALHTQQATSMFYMFTFCENLTALDVSGFDTSNVSDMSGMFMGCKKLTALDVTGFNTSHVSDLGGMFLGCEKLTALDLSSFDTSHVSDMSAMFNNCSKLTTLDLSGFDTSNVVDMRNMFYGTDAMKHVTMPNLQTTQVKNGLAGLFMDEGDTINGEPWKSYFKPEQYS